ncbi:yjeF C-terminal region, hydroxyethylthiazole kinase-related/yjeF N-terminal region [Poseidonocella pacifica]|uniref:Bifunctional NAD(P)H-hydrate repair enzyme n=1 Tax=Poseidonocella pacifica TaxID=871651 RepID=A0A1I0VAP7_9RHOB|nr:NAD(P)H-hydrate dehydratase [Poseidonocella pacifica]SFA73090.1 yjeF C-terminal region, hydroxyethylthiazole kinase-related/yjeF N-terminal region [Poseidonocella pacifica]
MTDLLSTAQMRATEARAIDSKQVSGADLMERAGAAVAAAIGERFEPGRALILAGPGNNGGDGFVIAHHLAQTGWTVEVGLLGAAEALPRDARAMHDRWADANPVTTLDNVRVEGADLVVDALFGTGLARPLDGRAADLARDTVPATCVAVDIPSGLCADSGRALGGVAFHAALTVTFHRPKRGHYISAGPDHCGELVVTDIGLEHFAEQDGIPLIGAPVQSDLSKGASAHKYHSGHAFVVAGGPGKGGAARLAARAALRIGAGLVTVGCPLRALTENAARLDAVMLRPLDGAPGLAEALEDERISSVCLGPGLGLRHDTQMLAITALRSEIPAVLDADALSRFSRDPSVLFGFLHDKCVLTPHGGEFARLFPDLAERLSDPAEAGPAYSRVDAAQAAAERAGCTVVLKGPDTIIAGPDGRIAVHVAAYDRAAPWLATAGAGDVLAGMIVGLIARGMSPFEAAAAAVWLHVQAARTFGPGLIAEDLSDALPAVFRTIGV